MKIRVERASEVRGKRDPMALPLVELDTLDEVKTMLRTDQQQHPRTEGLLFMLPDVGDSEAELHMLFYDSFIE